MTEPTKRLKKRFNRFLESYPFTEEETSEFEDHFLSSIDSSNRKGETRLMAMVAASSDPALEKYLRAALPWQPGNVDLLELPKSAIPAESYFIDASSLWMLSPAYLLLDAPKRFADMCAAPGGKSIFLSHHFAFDHHVCYEVDDRRRAKLRRNIARFCRNAENVVIPDQLQDCAEEGTFDLVLLDAPCSGDSLLFRGGRADGAFLPKHSKRFVKMQRELLKHAEKLVAPGGMLLYTTCTFSHSENEGVVNDFLEKASAFEAVEVSQLSLFRSRFSEFACYRLFPFHNLGAGGFSCLLKRAKSRRLVSGT